MTQPVPPREPEVLAQPRQSVSIWRVLGAALSVGLLLYLIAVQGWQEFFAALASVPPGAALAALAAAFGSRMFVSLRWFILLRAAGVRIGFFTSLRLVFMGLFASNFLPTTIGGDLVRLAGLIALPAQKTRSNARVDSAVAAASLVVDRLVGMAGMAVFLPFGLPRLLALNPAPAGQVALAGGLWRRAQRFLRRLFSSTVYWLRSPGQLLLAFLCTLGHSLCTFLAVWLLLDGLRQPVPFLLVGGLWSLSYFISLMPVSINGLGLQEVSIATLYARYGGVSPQAALALAVLMRMLFVLASAPGAAFLPQILQPFARRSAASAEETKP